MKKLSSVLAVTVLFFILPGWAEPITFEFSGSFLFPEVKSYSGRLTFDSQGGPDLFPDDPLAERYVFTGEPYGMFMKVGEAEIFMPGVELWVLDLGCPTCGRDLTQYLFFSALPGSVFGNPFGLFGAYALMNVFNDNRVNTVQTSGENGIPLSPPSLATYPLHKLFFCSEEAGCNTAENVDTMKRVFEPPAGLLLAVGLLALRASTWTRGRKIAN